jgi:hypothetical protein
MYTGIFITALFYFIIYCVVRKNQPEINPKLVLPGLISGIIYFTLIALIYNDINL